MVEGAPALPADDTIERLAAGAREGRLAPQALGAAVGALLLAGLALIIRRGHGAWHELVAALRAPAPGLGPSLAAFLLVFGALQVGGGLAASTLPAKELEVVGPGVTASPLQFSPGGVLLPSTEDPRARVRWVQLGPAVEALGSGVKVGDRELAIGQAAALDPGASFSVVDWRVTVLGPTPGETSRAIVFGQVVALLFVLAGLRSLGGPGALAAVGLRADGLPREVRRGLVSWMGTLPLYLLALFATAIATSQLGFKVSGHPLVHALEREGLGLLLPALVQAAVLAPFAEELLFRGLLLPGLQRTIGPELGFAACAVAFACVHGALGFLLPMTVLGCLFAGLRVTSPTGSLVAPITAHALHNGVTLALVGAVLLLSG